MPEAGIESERVLRGLMPPAELKRRFVLAPPGLLKDLLHQIDVWEQAHPGVRSASGLWRVGQAGD